MSMMWNPTTLQLLRNNNIANSKTQSEPRAGSLPICRRRLAWKNFTRSTLFASCYYLLPTNYYSYFLLLTTYLLLLLTSTT